MTYKRTPHGGIGRKPCIYIGAARKTRPRVLELVKLIEWAGAVVQSTWHNAELGQHADRELTPKCARDIAEQNCSEMRTADLAVFVRPPPSVGRGVWFDLGYCLGVQTPVWLVDGAKLIGGVPTIVARQQIYAELVARLFTDDAALSSALEDIVMRYAAGKD